MALGMNTTTVLQKAHGLSLNCCFYWARARCSWVTGNDNVPHYWFSVQVGLLSRTPECSVMKAKLRFHMVIHEIFVVALEIYCFNKKNTNRQCSHQWNGALKGPESDALLKLAEGTIVSTPWKAEVPSSSTFLCLWWHNHWGYHVICVPLTHQGLRRPSCVRWAWQKESRQEQLD